MEVMYEKNSLMGWNTTPPPTLRSFPSSTTGSVISAQNANSPPLVNRMPFVPEEGKKKNTSCFHCKREGHWVRDCPVKSPKRSTHPHSSAARDCFPIVHCHCGSTCVVRVSKTSKNHGREFYTCPCPLSSGKRCDFFEWCKDGTSDVNNTPKCGCEAGPCRIYKETSGRDAGRRFFVCPIKKGQGACKFSQPVDSTNNVVEEQVLDSSNDFLDEQHGLLLPANMDVLDEHFVDITTGCWDETLTSPQSTLTDSGDSIPSNRDSVEEGDSSHEGMGIECPVVHIPSHPGKLGTTSALSREERMLPLDSQGHEGTSDEPLRKHCKRLRHGDPKIYGFSTGSVNDYWEVPQSKSTDLTMDKAFRPSILTSGALVHRRQVKFMRQISSSADSFPGASSYHSSSAMGTSRELLTDSCLDTASIYQILGFNFKGWSGRLVFSPSGLQRFPPPHPLFCDIPIVIHIPSSVESSELPMLTSPSGALLCEPSGLKLPPKNCLGNTMKESVLEIFKQTALSLKNELLTLLETMDFRDHTAMLEESCSVFAALERLEVYYLPFKDQVMEYIGRAASLAEVELSIHNDDGSSHELFNSYNCKKRQLEDISCRHAETSSALEASNERLQHLQTDISRLKDMLLQAEEELACCKVENMEIDTHFNHISEDKLHLESNLEVLFMETEEAHKLFQQREAEQNLAKESFQKARSELRQVCNVPLLM